MLFAPGAAVAAACILIAAAFKPRATAFFTVAAISFALKVSVLILFNY
jgi:hypothetical protein